jgi:iron complex outermembrane receptor protein
MNRIRNIVASAVLLFTAGAVLYAQGGYTIRGVVEDQFGPVVGATVVEQGTLNGTTTGLDGDFTLKVAGPDSQVEISCIGYAPQTFRASQLPDTITLKEDVEFLDEVVVIGYGTAKKDDMTGSVAAIKADDLNRGAVTNTQDLLKGKVPGLLITPGDGGPGSGSRIRIRGSASLNASNDPLIVIDGVPIAQGAGGAMSNPLDLLNPNDIESFSVLKDASAAAIYGSRASNGVILITTKKSQSTTPQVAYTGSVSVQHVSKMVPVMTAAELMDFYSQVYPSGTLTGDRIAELAGNSQTDWQDLVFRAALATEHNLSVHGNVKERNLPYRASVGYLGQQGTLHGAYYDRWTADVSLNPKLLDDHLSFDLNAKGVYSYQDYSDGGVVSKAAFFNPTQDPYWRNPDGSVDYHTTNGFWNYGNGRGTEFSPNTLVGPSPLSMIYDNISTAKSYRFVGRAAVDYKIHGFEALSFNVSAGLDLTVTDSYNGVKPGSFQAYTDTANRGIGRYTTGYNLSRSQTLEAYAAFKETWGLHGLDMVAGYSWQNNYQANRSINYFNETHKPNLNPGETVASRYLMYRSENFLVSFYGRVNYSIDSRYVFTFTARGDGSSKFSRQHRWGFFPSGAFAWNIAREPFLKDVKAVNTLKLRLSVGQTGQQDGIGDYVYMARYNMSNNPSYMYNMGNENFMNMLTPQAYDPLIQWETTTTYNVGLDYGFFDNRLSGSVDAYIRDTKDLLNSVQVPMGSNFGNRLMTNVGSIRNQGLEIAVSGIPLQKGDWSMHLGVNMTFQDTKFTQLNVTEDDNYYIETGTLSKGTGGYLSRQMVGYAPYTYYTYKQKYDSAGRPVQNEFIDLDEDGEITEGDRYMTGKSPAPKFYYGLSMKLSWKDWDLGLNGHGAAGNWVFNDFASANSTASLDLNSGALPNQAQLVRTTGFVAPNSAQQWYSDYFLEHACFFRLDDLNLGYTFRGVGHWDTDIRLALGVQNVFLLTAYTGMDPEVTSENGIDNTMWPRPRTYSLRLNVKF